LEEEEEDDVVEDVAFLLPPRPVGITRYKTRFSYIIKTINCVEEDRLASMKYSR
jgi:hypothetical protein